MLRLTRRRPLYFGWTIVGALGITTVISYGTTAYAFGVLLAPVSQAQGWSRAALSGSYALGILVAGLLGIPIGHVVDRFGGRALMTVGSALGGSGLILLATVQTVGAFDLIWGIGLGLANALTFYPVSFTIIASWFEQHRGAALAWLTTIGGLASPIFIPLTGWLVAQLGWRETLTILGLTQLVVALPLHALVVRRRPDDVPVGLDRQGDSKEAGRSSLAVDRPPQGMTIRQALRNGAFWSLTVAGGLEQLAAMIVSAHQISFIITNGFDPLFAAGIAGLIGLVSLPGRFVLNYLGDFFDPQRLLVLVLGVLGLGVFVLTLATSATWLYLYVVVYGVVFGVRSPLRASVMAEHFGRRAYGLIIAVQGCVIAVPAAFGPLAAGWLYDRLGNYQLAFVLTAAAFVIAALLVLLTPHQSVAAKRSLPREA